MKIYGREGNCRLRVNLFPHHHKRQLFRVISPKSPPFGGRWGDGENFSHHYVLINSWRRSGCSLIGVEFVQSLVFWIKHKCTQRLDCYVVASNLEQVSLSFNKFPHLLDVNNVSMLKFVFLGSRDTKAAQCVCPQAWGYSKRNPFE